MPNLKCPNVRFGWKADTGPVHLCGYREPVIRDRSAGLVFGAGPGKEVSGALVFAARPAALPLSRERF